MVWSVKPIGICFSVRQMDTELLVLHVDDPKNAVNCNLFM